MQNQSRIFKTLRNSGCVAVATALIGTLVPTKVIGGQTQVSTEQKQASTAPQNAQRAFLEAANPAPTPMAMGDKKSRTVRVGVVAPKAALGSGTNGLDISQSIQNALVRYLSGPNAEITPIVAMLPQQIEAEIKDKNCDFVLYTGVTQKRGGMGLLRTAASMASMVPMVGMAAGAAGAIAGMAGGSALGGIAQASSLKAKSDIVFDYKLNAAAGNTTVLAETLNAKVKADGEDAISPLIARAATAILAKIASKPEATNRASK
jgi:hypothetical protein